jgi:ribosome-associated protein
MNSKTTPWHVRETSPSFLLAESAAYWVLTKKGTDVIVLDLRGRSDVCDFFLIASGQTDVQAKAIAGAVREGMAADHDLLHVEGLPEARWVLLDYVDVVVHVFQPEARQYYLLERLWGDAPRVEIGEAYFAFDHVRDRHAELPLLPARGAVASDDEAEMT